MLRWFLISIVLIINFFLYQYCFIVWILHYNLYDECKKRHKREFASSHETWHNSWFTKAKIWFKKQRKEHLLRFDMVWNTHTFWTNFICRRIIFWLYHFCTDCIIWVQDQRVRDQDVDQTVQDQDRDQDPQVKIEIRISEIKIRYERDQDQDHDTTFNYE